MDRFRVMYQVTVLLWVLAVAVSAQPPVREGFPAGQVFVGGHMVDSASGRFIFELYVIPTKECLSIRAELSDFKGVEPVGPARQEVVIPPFPNLDTVRFPMRLVDPLGGTLQYHVFCDGQEMWSGSSYGQAKWAPGGFLVGGEMKILEGVLNPRAQTGGRPRTHSYGPNTGAPETDMEFRAYPGSTRFSLFIQFTMDLPQESLVGAIVDPDKVVVHGPSEFRASGQKDKVVTHEFWAELVGADTGTFKYYATHRTEGVSPTLVTVYRHGDSVAFYIGDLRADLEAERKALESVRPRRFQTIEDSLRFIEDSALQAKYAPDGVRWIGHDEAGNPVPMTKEEFDRQWESTLAAMNQKQEIDSQRREELRNRRRHHRFLQSRPRKRDLHGDHAGALFRVEYAAHVPGAAKPREAGHGSIQGHVSSDSAAVGAGSSGISSTTNQGEADCASVR